MVAGEARMRRGEDGLLGVRACVESIRFRKHLLLQVRAESVRRVAKAQDAAPPVAKCSGSARRA